MAERPMFTMMVAVQPRGEAGPTEDARLDLIIHDIRGDGYLTIRTGGFSILLNEHEARSLAVAIEGLSEQATSLRSPRDYAEDAAGLAKPGEEQA